MATINAIDSNIPIEITKGGTNATTFATADGVVYYDGTRLVTTSAGVATQVLTSNGPGMAPTYQAAGGGGSGTIVTTFTVNGNWTPNAATKTVSIYMWNGGGGGGSGRRGVTTAAGGGSGGATGGAIFYDPFPVTVFPAGAQAVTIGASGAGGIAQTINNTNGNNGSLPTTTSVGPLSVINPNSTGGTGTIGCRGTGGQNGIANGGQGTSGDPIYSNSAGPISDGGNGTLTVGANASNQFAIPHIFNFAGAGGGGSGADSGTARQAGNGAQVVDLNNTILVAGAAGGIESGAINGTPGTDLTAIQVGYFVGGTGGGGGGGQSTGGAAGHGGVGGLGGAGGGGGGGSLAGVASGAGGAGGAGYVMIIEYT